MPVPHEDTVCRFVRHRDRSRRENRPRPGAFKQHGLSVWYLERLSNEGVRLEDLQFDSLQGSGQALLTVDAIFQAARTVEKQRSGKLHVDVDWRPDTVAAAWQQWSYAHAEVETRTEGETPSQDGELMSAFRMALCTTARCVGPAGPQTEKPDEQV